ncbi:hypothetical protein BGZ57DRAFT_847779 [Hyaloscypha finlandica]|nr:hypothetical protein BGZ57DRAFT_847779 [Hyaloscypha finlandica]
MNPEATFQIWKSKVSESKSEIFLFCSGWRYHSLFLSTNLQRPHSSPTPLVFKSQRGTTSPRSIASSPEWRLSYAQQQLDVVDLQDQHGLPCRESPSQNQSPLSPGSSPFALAVGNPQFIHGDEMEPEGKVVQQDMEVLAVGMIGTDDAIGEMIEGAEQEHAGLDAGDRARVRPEEEDFENRPTGNQKLEKDGSMEVHGEASEMEETGLAQDCMVVRAKDLKLHEEGHLEVGLVAPRQQIVTRRDYDNLMGKYMKVGHREEILQLLKVWYFEECVLNRNYEDNFQLMYYNSWGSTSTVLSFQCNSSTPSLLSILTSPLTNSNHSLPDRERSIHPPRNPRNPRIQTSLQPSLQPSTNPTSSIHPPNTSLSPISLLNAPKIGRNPISPPPSQESNIP